jgi:hypothetical protein
MENPEKLAAQCTQGEEKQNKYPKQYVLDTTIRKQTKLNINVMTSKAIFNLR